mgnify:CR=1 FL=1
MVERNIDIIITIDYEIYGDGSGDVVRDIISPTNIFLNICDTYSVPATIMFEIAEYLAFRETFENGKLTDNLSKLMYDQVQAAYSKGHDVQLHIHPQWLDYRYNGRWNINESFWKLSNLPNGYGSLGDPLSILGALALGKEELENIIRPLNPNYECIAFRAGGFCIQPSSEIIKALKALQIKIDTSLFNMGFAQTPTYSYDFRESFSHYGPWWTTSESVCNKGRKKENILEFPILAFQRMYLHNFTFSRLSSYIKEKMKFSNQLGEEQIQSKSGLSHIFKNPFSKYSKKWDFCKMSGEEMYSYLKAVSRHQDSNDINDISLVMIGHSKDFIDRNPLINFFKRVRNDSELSSKVNFCTFNDVLKKYQ